MPRRYSKYIYVVALLTEVISLNISFVVAHSVSLVKTIFRISNTYIYVWVLLNIVWLLVVVIKRPYHISRIRFHVPELIIQYITLVTFHFGLCSFCWLFSNNSNILRYFCILFYVYLLTFGVLGRVVGVLTLKTYRAFGYNHRRYLIVGFSKQAIAIRQFYDNHPELGMAFFGYFEERTKENTHYIKGGIEAVESYVEAKEIDYIYCCANSLQTETQQAIVNLSQNSTVDVKVIMDFKLPIATNSFFENHNTIPVIDISREVVLSKKEAYLKRSFDIVFSVLVLLLGFLVFVLIALITKLSSKGPVFFKQPRTGLWGKKFYIYKFRSMRTDAWQGHADQNKDEDCRITNWGRLIRKTRLDEIPQFYNVLIGDMSIVGPRPLANYDVDTLMDIAPNQFTKILSVRPGITSLGQIRFGYARTPKEMKDRLQYDLLYLKKVSFFFDVWIISWTIIDMVKAKGK